MHHPHRRTRRLGLLLLPSALGLSPRAVAITPDGTRAYVVNSEKHTVSVLDLRRRELLEVHDGKGSASAQAGRRSSR
jgi:DNA-binding beta-propeller fold protein YncE